MTYQSNFTQRYSLKLLPIGVTAFVLFYRTAGVIALMGALSSYGTPNIENKKGAETNLKTTSSKRFNQLNTSDQMTAVKYLQ